MVRPLPPGEAVTGGARGRHRRRAFAVIAVATGRNSPEAIAAFKQEVGVESLATWLDPRAALASAMGIPGLPVTAVLNREGAEIGRLTGGADWNSPQFEGDHERPDRRGIATAGPVPGFRGRPCRIACRWLAVSRHRGARRPAGVTSDPPIPSILPARNLEGSAWGAGAASAPPARANTRAPTQETCAHLRAPHRANGRAFGPPFADRAPAEREPSWLPEAGAAPRAAPLRLRATSKRDTAR